MTSPALAEIESKWSLAKAKLAQDLSNEDLYQTTLKPLHEECMLAGRRVADPVDRARLQWIAMEVGDSIFKTGKEYPATAIAPAEQQVVAWNVPPRNINFTGREEILRILAEELDDGGRVAVSGLGGIGKTEVAIEYAHRNRHRYQAAFWINADTEEGATADIETIANVLDLPEQHHPDQKVIKAAVKRWLESHDGWLLIFDNADELDRICSFFPANSRGHILLTTRSVSTARIAPNVILQNLDLEDSALLLLRRAGCLRHGVPIAAAKPLDREAALALAREMAGLPLALDQAGAYIEATLSSPAEYLEQYQRHGAMFRANRGEDGLHHHDSVSISFLNAFKQVSSTNTAAADLLRLCAFLEPNGIPEEILYKGASDLGDNLGPEVFDGHRRGRVLQDASQFSLLRRDPYTRTLSIHRLVQDVLKDQMSPEECAAWAERAVRAMARTFPSPQYEHWHFFDWQLCEKLFPHAFTCTELIRSYGMSFPEAATLLYNMGVYMWERGRYEEAEGLLLKALDIRERILPPDHPDLARTLHGLADGYRHRGRFREAEQLYRRELSIWEADSESGSHQGGLELSRGLHGLALLCFDEGRYSEAEPLFCRATALREKLLEPGHPQTAWLRRDLARIYLAQHMYHRAEPLLKQAHQEVLAHADQEKPLLGWILNDLAFCYRTGRPHEAERLLKESWEIQSTFFGADHPYVAGTVHGLAELYREMKREEEAEDHYRKAIYIWTAALGREHHSVAWGLDALGLLYSSHEERYEEAETSFLEAIEIREKTLGPEHPHLAASLGNYAALLRKRGDWERAEELEARARAIHEKVQRTESPDLSSEPAASPMEA